VRFAQYHLKTVEERKEFDKKLDEWYYQEGGAMFLSWTASRRLMEARNRLRCIKHRTNSSQETKDIQKAFSRLRTQLKFDSGVINSEEKEEEVGDLLAWQLNEIE
jgi:hypothetical protein